MISSMLLLPQLLLLPQTSWCLLCRYSCLAGVRIYYKDHHRHRINQWRVH